MKAGQMHAISDAKRFCLACLADRSRGKAISHDVGLRFSGVEMIERSNWNGA